MSHDEVLLKARAEQSITQSSMVLIQGIKRFPLSAGVLEVME